MNKKNIVILISSVIIITTLVLGTVYALQYREELYQQNIDSKDQVQQNESNSIDSSKQNIYNDKLGNYSMMIDPKIDIDTSNPNCVVVSNEIGSAVIESGINETPCGITGIGMDNELIQDYIINLGDRVVEATGFRNTLDNTGFVGFTFSDQVNVTLFVDKNQSNTEQEFQENLKQLEKFLIEDLMFM